MPRRPDRPSLDDFIQRGITLERFGNTVAERIRGMLTELFEDLMAELGRVDPGAAPRWREARLRKLADQILPLIRGTYGTILEEVTSDLEVLAGDEIGWLRDTWNRAGRLPPEALLDVALTERDLKTIVGDLLVSGGPAREWWARQAGAVQDRFMREVRMGMLRGESVAEMARRIRGRPTGRRFSWLTKRGQRRFNVEFEGGVLQANTRQAQALVRTAVQTVAGQVRRDTYLANRDVIKGIEQVSTLDSRTTPICRAYDGEQWAFEDEDNEQSGVSPTAKRPEKPKPEPVPVAVPKFKRVSEAAKWLKKQYPNVDFGFTGAKIGPIQQVTEEFHRLAQIFPAVVARMSYMGTYRDEIGKTFRGRPRQKKFSRGEWAHATVDGRRVGLNPSVFGDPERFARELARSVEAKFHPPGCDIPAAVLTHEFGHLVDDWLRRIAAELRDKNSPLAGVLDLVMRGAGEEEAFYGLATAMRGTTRAFDLRAGVSTYARTNSNEAFAESFASWFWTDRDSLSELARAMGKMLEGLEEHGFINRLTRPK